MRSRAKVVFKPTNPRPFATRNSLKTAIADPKAMETELTCAVCSDIYLEGRREPVTLPVCGHTFCRQCLLSIEKTDNFSCPYCRTKHPGPPVGQIATVYAILNLTKYLRRSKFGLCDSHNSTLDFWCQTCHTGLCGFCFYESQCKDSHDVSVMKNALDEKKANIGKAGSRFLESIDAEKATAMSKIHSYFEAVSEQCSNAESLNAQVKHVKELMADAENTLSMECAINVHEKMQEYLPSVRNSLEMTSDEVLSSSSTTSSSAHSLPQDDNTKSKGCSSGARNGVCQILIDDSRTDDDQSSQLESRTTGVVARHTRLPDHLSLRDSDFIEIYPRSILRNRGYQSTETTRGANTPENLEFARGFNSIDDEPAMVIPGAGNFEASTPDGGQSPERARLRQNDMASSEEGMAAFASAGWLSWSAKGDDGREGRFRWEDGRLHLYTLTDEVHIANGTIKLSVILSLLPRSPEIFLDFGADGVRLGRVYIRIRGDLRRAQHFLALCTGLLGPSYKGSRCNKVESKDKPGECLRVSHYVRTDGTLASRGLMGGLEWSGEHSAVKREGMVVSACGGRNDYDGCFDICTRGNPNKKFSCPFGEVVAGLEVVKEATCYDPIGDLTIMNTGVVVLDRKSRVC